MEPDRETHLCLSVSRLHYLLSQLTRSTRIVAMKSLLCGRPNLELSMTPHWNANLEQQVRFLLDSWIGLDVFPRKQWLDWQRKDRAEDERDFLRSASMIVSQYFFVFVVFPLVVRMCIDHPFSPFQGYGAFERDYYLYLLQSYGALWAGWATLTTKMLSSSLATTLYHDVIPHLSVSTSAKVAEDLRRQFPRHRFLVRSWLFGVAFAASAGVIVYQDLSYKPNYFEIVYWCLGWSLLFATSAGVVHVATFYEAFARNLSSERDLLFSPDPARSSIIISIAYLGQTVLLFWLSIALSIAFIIPFSLTRCDASMSCFGYVSGFSFRGTWFVGFYIVLASAFSIGLGVLGFLRSEADLRRVVREVTWRTLRSIEARSADLACRIDEPSRSALDELLKLSESHGKISTSGSYRGLIIGSASILIPFVAPVIAIISLIIGKR